MEAEPFSGSVEMLKTLPELRPSASVAERVPAMDELFSSAEPDESPVMMAGSSMPVMVSAMV